MSSRTPVGQDPGIYRVRSSDFGQDNVYALDLWFKPGMTKYKKQVHKLIARAFLSPGDQKSAFEFRLFERYRTTPSHSEQDSER